MTITYCDFTNGDDTTGDGSTGNPYKTMQKASDGLSGGDEVRCAKSPADTALTGTLAFTLDSTTLTGSSTLFTSELVVGDFVKGNDGEYYEVVTITDNTNAVLYQVYPSATTSGVSSYKLGTTSTGEVASAGVVVQTVTVSGTSKTSRLKVSGGWDLTGPTQDGQTYFKSVHSTFAYRYGKGFYIYFNNYLEIERVHFLRYYRGIEMRATGNLLTGVNCLSCSNAGLYIQYAFDNEFTDCVVNCNNNYGVFVLAYGSGIYTNLKVNGNSSRGVYLSTGGSNLITNLQARYNHNDNLLFSSSGSNTVNTLETVGATNGAGFQFFNCKGNVLTDVTCSDNDMGIEAVEAETNSVYNIVFSGNTSDITITQARKGSENPSIAIQKYSGTAGDNRCYYEYGETYRDTTDARSTQCLKYDPSSAIYYIGQSFFFVANSGVAQTLSAYIKDDASFNGDIQAAIFFNGIKVTGWTTWTPTTSYVKTDIVAGSGDITEDGVLELRIKVRGTAGNVFVDDLSTA